MALLANALTRRALCAIATCALAPACKKPAAQDPGPDLQIVSEALRLRTTDPAPRSSPFFDGSKISLVAARGETIAFQVLHRNHGETWVHVKGNGITVRGFSMQVATAKRGSTSGMYGPTHGTGAYRDGLVPDPEMRDARYFEIAVARDADAGTLRGGLVTGGRSIPIDLTVLDVTLPAQSPRVWAYYDPRELGWLNLGVGTLESPSEQEKQCTAMFRDHGVQLTSDHTLAAWPARKDLLGDFPYIKVRLSEDLAKVGDEVRGWIAATQGTGKVPFAIPVDEPRNAEARAKAKAYGAAIRDAGGGPNSFMFAVTAEPHADFADLVDLYITLKPKPNDTYPRWTYNGAPPRAGSIVLDALSPGARTWGWISWRYRVSYWYVWEGLYWHDRYNRKGAALPGRAFVLEDAISFDDGGDHGNLDGVLALPGDQQNPCRPTLRLAAIRRGMQDRQIIELAAQCKPDETAKLVGEIVPRALGDFPGKLAPGDGTLAWPRDDVSWETARRKLLELATTCKDDAR